MGRRAKTPRRRKMVSIFQMGRCRAKVLYNCVVVSSNKPKLTETFLVPDPKPHPHLPTRWHICKKRNGRHLRARILHRLKSSMARALSKHHRGWIKNRSDIIMIEIEPFSHHIMRASLLSLKWIAPLLLARIQRNAATYRYISGTRKVLR